MIKEIEMAALPRSEGTPAPGNGLTTADAQKAVSETLGDTLNMCSDLYNRVTQVEDIKMFRQKMLGIMKEV